ncbi:MAG: ABC transporter substrate-binding protein [Bacteroidetes bacterium]|nr:ABC transporter substrate-binding protein [Bacteroidota bacterium]
MNRSRVSLIALLLLIGGLAVPALAHAQDEAQDEAQEIREMLQERDREIKDILGDRDSFTQAQRDELMDLVNGVINFREMGRQALGPHWREISAAQRDQFVDVFSDIVRLQSLSDLEVYNSEVSYEEITVEGDSAYVHTNTIYQDTPTKVEYYMGKRDGEWFVHDIVLDEVSTVGGYERSFRRIINRRGFDALMNSLENRRERAREDATESTR